MNQTLTTDRLIVRARQLNDLEQRILMDQDARVTKYIRGPWADHEKHRHFVAEKMESIYPRGLGYWSVLDKQGNQDILFGWVLFFPYQLYGEEVEIGWRFVHASWGEGYATEAASVVIDHSFSTVTLQKVVADIDPLNISSIAVAKTLGM